MRFLGICAIDIYDICASCILKTNQNKPSFRIVFFCRELWSADDLFIVLSGKDSTEML